MKINVRERYNILRVLSLDMKMSDNRVSSEFHNGRLGCAGIIAGSDERCFKLYGVHGCSLTMVGATE